MSSLSKWPFGRTQHESRNNPGNSLPIKHRLPTWRDGLLTGYQALPQVKRHAALLRLHINPDGRRRSSVLAGQVRGFSLHADVAAARESRKLEKRCRYITRPAFSEKRLSISPQGSVRGIVVLQMPEPLVADRRKRKNLFAALSEAVKSQSVGQISRALHEAGGVYRRNI